VEAKNGIIKLKAKKGMAALTVDNEPALAETSIYR
jgi:hypothetical protein